MVSRVAKNPIKLPAGVEVKISGRGAFVKGKLGELQMQLPTLVSVAQENGQLKISTANNQGASVARAGTARAILQHMVTGVSAGFTKKLVMVGVGYRAKVQGNALDLSVGFSHPYVMKMPKGIAVECPSNTEIVLKGADLQMLNQTAANIRAVRPPEPYKGKGIRYENEQISLKEGKKK